MAITVQIDDDTFYKAMVSDLKDCLANFEKDMEEACPNIFVFGDPVADKIQIQAHIDALKLILSWYEPQ